MEHGQSHGVFENSEIFQRCMGVVEIFLFFVSFWFFTNIPVSAREHAVSLLISNGGDLTQTTCGIFLNFKCSESRTNFLLHKKQFHFCSQNFGLIMSQKRKDRPSFFTSIQLSPLSAPSTSSLKQFLDSLSHSRERGVKESIALTHKST